MQTKTTYLSELDAARVENQQLGSWYHDLQEKYLRQERKLAKAVRFIERQSGAMHYEDLYFVRDVLGDFWINKEGFAEMNHSPPPYSPFNEPTEPEAA